MAVQGIVPVNACQEIAVQVLQALAIVLQPAPKRRLNPRDLIAPSSRPSKDRSRCLIGQSPSCYNLSGADITALKNAGVSSQVLTAMLNHDSALRVQEQSSSPGTATAIAPQPTVTQSDAVSATAIVSQTPIVSGILPAGESQSTRVSGARPRCQRNSHLGRMATFPYERRAKRVFQRARRKR